MQNLIKKIEKIQYYLNSGVFETVGSEAVRHYKKSFLDEGFTDRNLKKWKNVKRRLNPRDPKAAAASLPILTGSGELADSIKWARGSGRTVVISSDKVYAQVHNEGLRAGRGKGFQMPKRQFIGKSAELTKKINAKVAKQINIIANI
ncbi:MAG: phage virion morphogenesis protein [Prevotellaceae bacterium]|jgi:phage gpG-like protein|nr:phage virion morphogenesis protein [Prevotellaceae bacterium]